MKHRYYTQNDYLMLTKWWESWDWMALPEVTLPATGIIITNQGVDICAAFLYKTDSAVCWAENFIIDKQAPRDLRRGAVECLIKQITIEAKEQGFAVMMSSIQHEGLIKKLIASGYSPEYEKNMCNLVRVL